jgi:AcrR family transcriptional regulator
MAKAVHAVAAAPAGLSESDGRSLRAGRTREAIVDALFVLLEAGEVQPTGEQIAERAGVSLRSVFLHFPTREQLFAAITERQVARIAPLFQPLDADAPLAERIDAFVAQRARVLEAVTALRRAAVLMEPRSELVARKLAEVRAGKRAQAEWVFDCELAACPKEERRALAAALGAACDWNAWQSWRAHQGLSAAGACAAMRLTLRRLLGAS